MANAEDFENIYLSKSEFGLLKKLNNCGRQNSHLSEAEALLANGLATRNLSSGNGSFRGLDGYCSITDKGKKYISYRSNKKVEKISNELRGWITTAIAIAAFLKSFWPDILKLFH